LAKDVVNHKVMVWGKYDLDFLIGSRNNKQINTVMVIF